MSEGDPLDGVEGRLRALDACSLVEHADVLEEVHQLLVTELDRLGGAARTGHGPAGGEAAGHEPGSDDPAGGEAAGHEPASDESAGGEAD